MSITSLPPVRTKQQSVYDILREHIINGDLVPGQRLVIDELARQLGVSNIPIREALKLLEAERLIDITPHVGARVAPLDPAMLDELFWIRTSLEELAIRAAATRLTSTDLDALDALSAAMRQVGDDAPPRQWRDLNFHFHMQLYRLAGKPILADLIRGLWERSFRAVYFRPVVPLMRLALCDDHDRLLAALRQGNAETAGAAIREHIERARRAFRDYFAEENCQGE